MAESQRPQPGPPPHSPEAETARRVQAREEEETTRSAAEARTANLPQPGIGGGGPMTPEQYVQAMSTQSGKRPEGMVKMTFPVPVTLTLANYLQVQFANPGVNDVPESLVDEVYLRDNGVTKF